MQCTFEATAEDPRRKRCTRCGRVVATSSPARRVFARCTAPAGLGDALAAVLKKLGVGRRRNCRCAARQAWLNRLFPYRTSGANDKEPGVDANVKE